MPAPAGRQQPRPRLDHRAAPRAGPRLARRKPVEERRRGARIDDRRRHRATLLGRMATGLQKHISKGVADLARRRELPRVIAVANDAARAPERAVEPPRNANREPARARRESALVPRLDDEVQVVRLNSVLNQAKPKPLLPVAKRAAKDGHAPLGPEVGHTPRDPERHVDRRSTLEHGTSRMPERGIWRARDLARSEHDGILWRAMSRLDARAGAVL